jgi:predicted ribosomally synthesized peptide with SipW-like signal peptide
MKNIFLSVVVICALAVAGVGGTLATLTDTEESYDNYIEVGSLDLKVNDNDDYNVLFNDEGGVGAVIQQTCIIPGDPMGSLVKVENEGCLDGYLYVVIKNNDCYNVIKEGAEGWYLDDMEYDAEDEEYKPEPEMVTEYGGMLAQVCLPAQGVTGDNCCMNSHTYCTGVMTQYPIYPEGSGNPFIDHKTLGALKDEVKYVGVLPHCGGDWYLHFYFDVPQEDESPYTYFDDASPFNDWVANALMADGISFDVMFILVDHQLSAAEIDAIEGDL